LDRVDLERRIEEGRLNILVPVWHLHVLDHIAQLFPESTFCVVGSRRLGDFGYPYSKNIYLFNKSLSSVSTSRFDLFFDVGHLWSVDPEEYYRASARIDLPRVFLAVFLWSPYSREYYLDLEGYPLVFEESKTMNSREWSFYPRDLKYLIYNVAPLFYYSKWIGDVKGAFTVFNYHRQPRLYREDDEVYIALEDRLGRDKFYVHDGSVKFLSEDKLVRLYSRFRVYIEGSKTRRITNAFLQALAIGIPTLVLENDLDYTKLIERVDRTLLFRTVDEGVEKIETLLEDYTLARNISLTIKSRVRDLLSPEVVRSRWKEVFYKAVETYFR